MSSGGCGSERDVGGAPSIALLFWVHCSGDWRAWSPPGAEVSLLVWTWPIFAQRGRSRCRRSFATTKFLSRGWRSQVALEDVSTNGPGGSGSTQRSAVTGQHSCAYHGTSSPLTLLDLARSGLVVKPMLREPSPCGLIAPVLCPTRRLRTAAAQAQHAGMQNSMRGQVIQFAVRLLSRKLTRHGRATTRVPDGQFDQLHGDSPHAHACKPPRRRKQVPRAHHSNVLFCAIAIKRTDVSICVGGRSKIASFQPCDMTDCPERRLLASTESQIDVFQSP